MLECPSAGKSRDLVEALGGGIGQDRVEDDVDDGVALGEGGVAGEGGAQGLAGVGEDHVADGGDAAGGGGAGAAVEVVAPGRLAGDQLGRGEVDVEVDAAGEEVLAAGVELAGAAHGAADLGDLLAPDADVGLGGVAGGDDGSPANDQIEGFGAGDHHVLPSSVPGPAG